MPADAGFVCATGLLWPANARCNGLRVQATPACPAYPRGQLRPLVMHLQHLHDEDFV